MAKAARPVTSLATLRRRIPSLVEAINADPALAVRAAANPILAAEELGVRLSERLQQEAEIQTRFPPEAAADLTRLAGQIRRIARERDLDLRAPDRITATLIRLRVPIGDAKRRARRGRKAREASSAAPEQRPAPDRGVVAFEDPRAGLISRLEPLANAHRIVPPLLAYLRLDATRPPLASREAYDRLRAGKGRLPTLEIRYRLRREF